jgi:hypothetical protein
LAVIGRMPLPASLWWPQKFRIYFVLSITFVCSKLLTLMKKYLVLIATMPLVLGACETASSSQLPREGEGVAKEGSSATQEKQTTPEPSPSGTPKTYFPQNS